MRDTIRRPYVPLFLATLAILGGCAKASQSQDEGRAPAPKQTEKTDDDTPKLQVVNRSSVDMDIYVLRSGQRIPLGLAPGDQTTSFALRDPVIVGTGFLQLVAVPRRSEGRGRPVTSETFGVNKGAVLSWDIPPQ